VIQLELDAHDRDRVRDFVFGQPCDVVGISNARVHAVTQFRAMTGVRSCNQDKHEQAIRQP
jgi:hypothetical protein